MSKDYERKMKQIRESVILVTKAVDRLISAVTEATKALQEYQKVADSFFLKEEEYDETRMVAWKSVPKVCFPNDR